MYVQSGIYDEFVESYAETFKTKESVIGDPEQPGTEIGPVVDKAQFERIMKIISTANKEQQGTLLSGGKAIDSKVRPSIQQARLLRSELTVRIGVLYRAHNLHRYKGQCHHLQGRDIRTCSGY